MRIFCLLFLALTVPAFGQSSTSATPAAQNSPDEKTAPNDAPVTPPRILSAVNPEGVNAKYKGSVQVSLDIEKDGTPSRIQIVHGMSSSIDAKVLEAVRQYKFVPAMRNGKPVKVALQLAVNIN